ncbi:MAG: DivIVA domain-containing protein [Propionibacteriaceae bacterium]|jgi:DivIVA domain-containing protein|nr:DivIVA domain-containing protein [Propionibacteriaceae bacterium]
MEWFIALLAVLVAGLVWLAMHGHLGGMPPLIDDRPGPDLAEGTINATDLRTVRFAVTARGYAMQQVDAVLDRVADQLDSKALSSGTGNDFAGLGWPTSQ